MAEELPVSVVSWVGKLTSNSFWATHHRFEIDLRSKSEESYYAPCRFNDEITVALVSREKIKITSHGDPVLVLIQRSEDNINGIYEMNSPREQGTFILKRSDPEQSCTIS